ncbi:hypothetical protein Tco_1332012 [Tanacetum coccineum]
MRAASPLPLLPSPIRPPHTRAVMAQMRAAAPSTHHLLLPSGTTPLLPIPLPAPSTAHRDDTPDVDMSLRKRAHFTAPTRRYASIRASERKTMTAVEVVKLRVSYLSDVRRRERRQDVDDRATNHIMRTQALVAKARVDTLEDVGSSS